MEQKRIGFFGGLDFVTMITALIGSAYGLTLIYSATFSKLTEGKIITSDVRSTLISVAGGIVFALIVCNIDYEIISKLWPIIAGGCILLMIITMFFGVAVNESRQDARSWLNLGFFTFQTSELLKVDLSSAFPITLIWLKIILTDLKQSYRLLYTVLYPLHLLLQQVMQAQRWYF